MKYKVNKLFFITLLLVLNINCRKEKVYPGDTYFGRKVMVLGHAGMGIGYIMPQNTYESIGPAIDIGCDGCEIDIQLTRDSVLVAYHNFDLPGQTLCDGRIIDLNWASLRDCKYRLATKHIFLYSVEDLFNRFPNLGELYFSFDCKLESARPDQQEYEYRLMRAIKRLCDKYKMEQHVLIEGPAGFLDKAKILDMENKLFLFTDNEPNPVDLAKQKYAGILHSPDLSAEEIKKAHQNGLLVMIGAPRNLQENKEVLDKQPDIIQTDDPKSILKLMDRFNYENVTP